MAQTLKLKRSAVSGKAPALGDLALGELGLNTFDGKLYTRKDNGTASIVELSGGGGDVTLTGTQTLTNKTLTDPAITGTILEDVFTITDVDNFLIDPGNGSIQLITLGASRTPTCNFAAGESVTLMVDDGTNRTITWTSTTWGPGGVKWRGGTAPTLATTGYSVIQFWKVGSQVYGASVGDVA